LINFKTLALSLRDEYLNNFYATEERASDYSFINLWAWNDERCHEIAFHDGLCWIRLTASEPFEMWAPIGNWFGKNWKDILGRLFPEGNKFCRVPEKLTLALKEKLGDMIEINEERSEWEYIYSAKELINLSGNRFHSKKNLLRQFLKYNPVYEEINSENIGEIMVLQSERKPEDQDKLRGDLDENIALKRVLSNWDRLPGIMGGVLRIDGKIVAYTIAEDIGNGTLIIHFEKGFYLDLYKGVYQGINQIFLKNSGGKFSLVNREQDMGHDGLRQAKMTYNPIGFIRKYTVRWKG